MKLLNRYRDWCHERRIRALFLRLHSWTENEPLSRPELWVQFGELVAARSVDQVARIERDKGLRG